MDLIRAQTSDILATSSPILRDCKSADPRVFITDLDDYTEYDYDGDVNDDFIDTISIENSCLPVSSLVYLMGSSFPVTHFYISNYFLELFELFNLSYFYVAYVFMCVLAAPFFYFCITWTGWYQCVTRAFYNGSWDTSMNVICYNSENSPSLKVSI